MNASPLSLLRSARSLIFVLSIAACGGDGGDAAGSATEGTSGSTPQASTPSGPQLVVDVTAERGLPATEGALPAGDYAMPEIIGQGVGIADLDGDGRLDIVQPTARMPWTETERLPTRLWMQQDDGSFADEAAARGIAAEADDYGVSIADANDDGELDVLLLSYGPDRLYRGQGAGRFSDVSDASGITSDDWAVAGAWLDHDRDGDLDLFVVNYIRWNPDTVCIGGSGQVDYCGPDAFDPWPDVLYTNDGDGTFTDGTVAAGVERPGSGLGVVTADLSGDGWVDIYVANDMRENHLWVNRTDGTFREEAMLRGVGVNGTGRPEASMGVCLEDVDLDGGLDLFMTHIQGQTNTLYSTVRAGLWSDVTASGGMGQHDTEATGFGCAFFDLEHDGDLDLVVANGRVYRLTNAKPTELGDYWSSYGDSDFLFTNDGDGRFQRVTGGAFDLTSPSRVSRGIALGDLDGDGDVDFALSALGNRLRLFENRAASGHWLRVDARVAARPGARSAIGAEVTLLVGDRSQKRVLSPTYSYASSSEPVLHFGLGTATTWDELRIRWPDGSSESHAGGDADQTIVLTPGAEPTSK